MSIPTNLSLLWKDMDGNEHERLSNFTLRHKAKEQCCYCCAALHNHNRAFNNNSYTTMSIKPPLTFSWAVLFTSVIKCYFWLSLNALNLSNLYNILQWSCTQNYCEQKNNRKKPIPPSSIFFFYKIGLRT